MLGPTFSLSMCLCCGSMCSWGANGWPGWPLRIRTWFCRCIMLAGSMYDSSGMSSILMTLSWVSSITTNFCDLSTSGSAYCAFKASCACSDWLGEVATIALLALPETSTGIWNCMELESLPESDILDFYSSLFFDKVLVSLSSVGSKRFLTFYGGEPA